jgi:exosortase/archaeosortase
VELLLSPLALLQLKLLQLAVVAVAVEVKRLVANLAVAVAVVHQLAFNILQD